MKYILNLTDPIVSISDMENLPNHKLLEVSICFGHLIDPKEPLHEISLKEIVKLIESDIVRAVARLNNLSRI